MIPISSLPTVNAILNGISASLLTIGYVFIRRKKVTAHKICMTSAFGVSTLFLVSYLTYHYYAGSVSFTGHGWIRPIYFAILVSHIILAALILPLALITLFQALTERYDKHKWIARWTLPVWFYVCVTGVVIYVMLYRL